MYHTQQELMNGNSEIAEYYKNAKELWEEIDIDDVDLSRKLIHKQPEFEHSCGGRGIGQEIMAWSGMMLYMNEEESDIESATKVHNALVKGSCSNEVKTWAKDAGAYFKLN